MFSIVKTYMTKHCGVLPRDSSRVAVVVVLQVVSKGSCFFTGPGPAQALKVCQGPQVVPYMVYSLCIGLLRNICKVVLVIA